MVAGLVGGLVLAAVIWRGRQTADQPVPLAPGAVPPTEVGIGLSGIDYYSSDDPFVDVVKTRGRLVLPDPWREKPAALLDRTGHPVHVPRGTDIGVVLRWDARSTIGAVDCLISRGWARRIVGNGQITGSDRNFRVTFARGAGQQGESRLVLRATAAFSDMTTLVCRAAGAPPGATFTPVFLADLRPFRVLRFMDWMGTNNAPPRDWAARRTPAHLNQIGEVALEHMVDLANTAHADPWFNLPLDASPDYYRRFALYVRDHLAPDRKVYVELSNEVWNIGFKQGQDATASGKRSYPGIPEAQAADFYYADRLKAAMAIWSAAFAGRADRLVRVGASQSAWSERAENILSHDEAWRSIDLFATAPYFGTDGLEAATADSKARIDALFATGAKAVDDQIKAALAVKAIAARYGLRYGTYEGGPGYYNSDPQIQAQLNDMARDPRMADLYTLFLERWRSEVGGLFLAYNSIGVFAQYGAWGHKEYAGQPLGDAPKMRALVNFIDRNRLNH